MNKRLRLAIVGSVIIGTLLFASYPASQRRSTAVRAFDWGENARGDGVLNAVLRIDDFDSERGHFSYYTGARSGDVGPLIAAPTRVLAEAAHGSVRVRVLGPAEHERARATDEALDLARIVSAATTGVFPAAVIPVEIDLHFMPEGARFSLAKRVDWREGRPYALAVFAREHMFDRVSATTAHEFYHVLAGRWALRSAPGAQRRPKAANSFEESAADLFAACGKLLANETLAKLDDASPRITIVDQDGAAKTEFEGVLAGDELGAALEIIANDRLGANGFGYLLSRTVLDHMFGEAGTIALDSPQATALLALCKETSANPFALEAWLAGRLPPTHDASDSLAN